MDEETGDVTTSTDEELELDLSGETEDVAEEVDWKAKAEKAEAIAENQRIRAEKAEKLNKEKKDVVVTPPSGLSETDIYALVKANVPEEDIPDVREYATLKNISLAEALKTNVVKNILQEKKEEREVSEATNVSTARRTTQKASDETLLSEARSGKMPEKSEDITRLLMARRGVKK